METTSGVLDGLLALPGGGGGVRGIGERFQPDRLRGSGSYAIPLPQPKGPNELEPSLSLRYSSGQGNGPFGVGWQLAGPLQVSRRTDAGVPRYDEGDELTLAGADVLVPIGGGRYRPRSDRQGWRIQRLEEGWQITTKEGSGYTLGTAPAARVADGRRVFAWLLERETDAAGNAISYRWEHEAGHAYLAEISWGIYAVRLRYEQRPDPLRDGRAGFPRRMLRRCVAIERFADRLEQPLINRHELSYEQAKGSGASLLTEVRLSGHGADGASEEAPPVRLEYSQPSFEGVLRQVGGKAGLPPLDAPGTTLVDMDGDGLPDVLETGDGGHRWWRNRGDGEFDPPRRLSGQPAGMKIGRRGVTFADLDGNGTADLIRAEAQLTTVVPNTGAGAWGQPRAVRSAPAIGVSEDRTRLVDLDGDGVTDLLRLGGAGAIATYNRDGGEWSDPEARLVGSEGGPPPVDLAAPGVHLADMTGDGLPDIVFAASGRVEYWPSNGHSSWGERVEMEGAPVLPHRYDPDRLHLADLDGDGVADLLYLDGERVLLWINRGGVGWSEAQVIPYLPPPGADGPLLVDLLGSGTRGLLWARSRHDGTYNYLDLAAATKPNLLTRIDHGDGGSSEITYETTTALRAADEAANEAWTGFLPFPVHVVAEIVEDDAVTERSWTTRMRYFDGVWAGTEREFRGFGRVETLRVGDGSTPDVLEESSFDVAGDRQLAGSPTAVAIFELDADGARIPVRSATIAWEARLEHDGPGGKVHFPHATRAEVRDHARLGEGGAPLGPDRIEVAEYEYDEHGGLVGKRRAARFADQPEEEALRTEERIVYARDEAGLRVGLPAAVELRDGEGRLLKATQYLYDGPAFEGLPLGRVEAGLPSRTRELALADWALPDGYAEGIDPEWGLVHEGEGWWRTTAGYERDGRGNLIGQRDGLGGERRIAYDADGLFPVRQTGPGGEETVAEFDPRTAAAAEMTLADGRRVRYEYSPLGGVSARYETSGDGSLQLVEANRIDHGDFAAAPPRPPRLVTWRPLEPGLAPEDLPELEAASPQAVVSCEYFDSFGSPVERLSRVSAAAGAPRWSVSRQRLHSRGGDAVADFPNSFAPGPDFVTPSGDPTRFSYDALGGLREVRQGDGGRLRVERRPGLLRRWDATREDGDEPTVERYDALGRLIAVEEPAGNGATVRTAYEVDLFGRVLSVQDGGGRVSARYAYAGPGAAIRAEHADAGVRTYFRDAEGRLRRREDSLGRRLEMEYDALGRLVAVVDATDPAHPRRLREIEFDGPRLLSAREGELATRFEYDEAGRATARTVEFGPGDSLTLRREFGLQGELRAIVHPDGARIEYRQDETGVLTAIEGWVDGIEYDAAGDPIELAFPGGGAARYEYDATTRRMRTAALEGPGGTLREARFEYDPGGRLSALEDTLTDADQRREFAYDGLSRLVRTELSGPGGNARTDEYAYSPAGDLLRNDESPLTAAMEYGDPAHAGRLTRLRAATGETVDLDHDAGGRLTALGSEMALEYDVWDRLVRARLKDGTVVSFAYDFEGTRVRKLVEPPDGTRRETRYLEDLYVEGPDGVEISVRLGSRLIGRRTAGPEEEQRASFVLTDRLGSVLGACDEKGALVSEQVYSPFGRSLGGGEGSFAGAAADPELGLVQFGARFYAPALGRFVTPDWFVIENPASSVRVPQALNAYSYALNNPLVLRDPSGRWFGFDDVLVAAAGFVVGFVAGVIAGVADGRSFGDSLVLGLEAGLVGAAGAWLAWNSVGLLGAGSGSSGLMMTGAFVGGLNGALAGAREMYDFDSPVGWAAFVLDSSWGLLGTGLGLVLQGINLFYGAKAGYNSKETRHSNRHVFDHGFGFGKSAHTQGNVTSNMRSDKRRADRVAGVRAHESLHSWQSRIFGPIYQATYVGWLVAGTVVGIFAGMGNKQLVEKDIKDMAYYNNPWEIWGFAEGGGRSLDERSGELGW